MSEKNSGYSLPSVIAKYGRFLTVLIDFIIIVSVTVLTLFTTYLLYRDLAKVFANEGAVDVSIILNDIFLLVIYAEVVRSTIAAHEEPEAYLVSIAEVGFVISIREMLASVIREKAFDVFLSSLASLVLTITLLILYKWIVPRKPPVTRREMVNKT